jgi:surface antigen
LRRRFWVLACLVVGLAAAPLLLVDRPRSRSHTTLPRGQCTWYAAERAWDAGWGIKFDTNWGRHARHWPEKVVNATPSDRPRRGAIMVVDAWPGNEYGHVAYVEEVESDDRWIISHANMSAGEPCGTRDGFTVYRSLCERTSRGVSFDGRRPHLRLRTFLIPKVASRLLARGQ